MEVQLQRFSESLALPDSWLERASATFQDIFLRLQQRSRFSLDRFRVVGGVAKKTSTCLKADVDILVYFNDGVSREQVLDEFENILLRERILEKEKFIKNPFLISFKYRDVPIDLVVTKNLVESTLHSRDESVEKNQARAAYRQVKKNPHGQRELTLSIQSVIWMKEQNKFCHDLARLAKYWSQTIFYNENVFGQSYIIELLAVHSALNTFGQGYLPGFVNFLNNLTKLRTLSIKFKTSFYPPNQTPPLIANEVPMLLDPVNPYKNLLHGVPTSFIDVFGRCAEITISRLRITMPQSIDAIFMPQQLIYSRFTSDNYVVGTRAENIFFPEVVFNKTPATPSEFVKMLLLNIASVIKSNVWQREESVTRQQVITIVKSFVDETSNSNSRLDSDDALHRSKLCTLKIPVKDRFIVMVSFNFH